MSDGSARRSETPQSTYASDAAAKLVALLAAGTAPWQQPWEAQVREAPNNPTTGASYRSGNGMMLRMEGRTDPRWMTFNQATATGYAVRKGERGVKLSYWKVGETRDKLNPDGSPVVRSDGAKETVAVTYSRPRQFFFTVFNAEQLDGIAPHSAGVRPEKAYPAIEAAIEASGVRVVHNGGTGAYYQPARDTIALPTPDRFQSTEHYYSTALHELGHATGHETRLGRDLSHPFGSAGYAREELRAEIASMMLSERFGVGHDPGRHAAYVGSWIKALQEDPAEIFRAARDAEGIADFVTALAATWALEKGVDAADRPADLAVRVERGDLSRGDATPEAARDGSAAPAGAGVRVALPRGGDWEADGAHDFRAAIPAAWAALQRGQTTVQAQAEIKEGLHLVVARADAQDYTGALGDIKMMRERVDGGALGTALGRVETGLRLMAAHAAERVVAVPRLADESKTQESTMSGRTYLRVPYAERQAAKEAGARWDSEAKSWFAPQGAPVAKLARWLPENTATVSELARPEQQFGDALRARGFQVEGDPVMDGTLQRVKVDRDRGSERSGAYKGFTDGTPAGYIENFRTGSKETWVARVDTPVVAEEAAALREAAAARTVADRATRDARHATMASVYADLLAAAPIASGEHRYASTKGVSVTGMKQVPSADALPATALLAIAANNADASALRKATPGLAVLTAGDLIVPLSNAAGALTGIQTISPGGFKMFAEGGRASGSFFKIDGDPATVAVVEGWATARTVADTTGWTVYAAMSSANIESVARTARAALPGAVHLIGADDDRGQDAEGKRNVGREKALAAGVATGTHVAFAPFGASEKGSDWNDFLAVRGKTDTSAALATERELARRATLAPAHGPVLDAGREPLARTQDAARQRAEPRGRVKAAAVVREAPSPVAVSADRAEASVKRAGRGR